MPKRLEPLEWLVDFFGRTSDSFRLPDALAQLAQAAEKAGNTDRARQVYEQLIDRNPEDESVRRRYSSLLARLGMKPAPDLTPPVKVSQPEPEFTPTPPTAEPPLDDDTQRFVAQALTDVDLFSSYGLAQKAIELLEEVRLRAPGHSPILERLLDLHLGAGDERRTAELAAQLEQLWNTRGDRARAERFAELRQRFQRAAGLDTQDIADANARQAEDAVPVVEAEPVSENAPQPEIEIPAVPIEPATPEVPAAQAETHEVDLSEEWASLSQQLEEAAQSPSEPVAELTPVAETPTQQAEPQPIEPAPPVPAEPSAEEYPAFDLELEAPAPANEADTAVSADQLLAELAADLDAMVHLVPKETTPDIPARTQAPPVPPAVPIEAPAARDSTIEAPAELAPMTPASTAATGDTAGPLGDVFEEFRAELGEMGAEDEDLETHYNLGVAYREMGLLEEAISEFQKVAKANEKGQPFRYAMQCCTLLGLLFMEKGQPAIAAMWYERALRVPGLDQEAILALRYDLGVAQELAGDTAAALKSFLQVYASNIDYRDVADRITALERAR
jgi:tetratricopeptide (TPR) repeat protein